MDDEVIQKILDEHTESVSLLVANQQNLWLFIQQMQDTIKVLSERSNQLSGSLDLAHKKIEDLEVKLFYTNLN